MTLERVKKSFITHPVNTKTTKYNIVYTAQRSLIVTKTLPYNPFNSIPIDRQS